MAEILFEGDCLEVMKTLESESVDCVITSPAYPGVGNLWRELFKAENFDKAHESLNRVGMNVGSPGAGKTIGKSAVGNSARDEY